MDCTPAGSNSRNGYGTHGNGCAESACDTIDRLTGILIVQKRNDEAIGCAWAAASPWILHASQHTAN